jgi:hypothetical protein
VTLDNVYANWNQHGGASINTWGNVAVEWSEFNCNGGNCIKTKKVPAPLNFDFKPGKPNPATGLDIETFGNVTLIGVMANRNSGHGIDIETKKPPIKPPKGMSLGNVMMALVMARENDRGGARIDAQGNVLVFGGLFSCNGGNCDEVVKKVDILKASKPGKGASGLTIRSRGNVLLVGVAANRNSGHGIKIESRKHTLMALVMAMDNDRGGVKIDAGGHVAVLGGLFGCNGNGCDKPGEFILGATGLEINSLKNVYVVGVAAFRNTGYGIKIETLRDKNAKKGDCYGNVMLLYVAANNNLRGGATIDAVGKVRVFRSMFNENGFKKFGANGLDIHAHRNVFLAKVEANGNSGYGITVDVQSKRGSRAVTLLNVVARRNGKGGAYISNMSFGRSRSRCNCNYGGVFIINSKFSGNDGAGVKVLSSQPVTLFNVSTNRNTRNGATIIAFGRRSNVRIIRSNFNNNNGMGLAVLTTGNVTLRGVTANANRFGGAAILTSGNVRVIRSDFSRNGFNKSKLPLDNGLLVLAKGNVTLRNVTTMRNRGAGVIVISGNAVTLNNVSARMNGRNGATIIAIGRRSNVSVFNSRFINNGGNGLFTLTSGYTTLRGVRANRNDLNGALVFSDGKVIVRRSTFNSNVKNGIKVWSNGRIVLRNVTACYNGKNGAVLKNTYGGRNVIVRDSNFCENDANGLKVRSAGTVIIDNIVADSNTGHGAVVNNNGGNGVVVTGSNFNDNGGFGLAAMSSGTIVLNGLDVIGNGLSGAGLIANEIHVINSNFNGNGQYGILAFLNNGGTMFLWCNVDLSNNGTGELDLTGDLALVKEGVIVLDCDVEFELDDPFSLAMTGFGQLPIIYPVTGGELIDICGQVSSLILPNGNMMTFSSGVCDQGSLSGVDEASLPFGLPPGFSFVSSMLSEVIQGGTPVYTFPYGEWSILTFPIPEGLETADFSILYWDETANGGLGAWIEVTPFYVNDGYATAIVNYSGMFVLATK